MLYKVYGSVSNVQVESVNKDNQELAEENCSSDSGEDSSSAVNSSTDESVRKLREGNKLKKPYFYGIPVALIAKKQLNLKEAYLLVNLNIGLKP